LVGLLVLVADQVTKSLVVSQLSLGQTVDLFSWLSPLIRLTYITNTGVAFGLFPSLGNVFKVVPLVVVAILLVYNRQLPNGEWLTRIALGLQMGGALGNLVDRLVRGAVVDFLDFNFWPLKTWPIFNLSDASVVAGAALLGLTLLLQPEKDPREETVAESGLL
jgi:signal peptidase II